MASFTGHYDQDEVVAEVSSYYDFLADIYLPSSIIKRPLPAGWPDLTSEFLAPLAKNKVVENLIQHLPYVARDDHDPLATHQIYENTAAVDFTGGFVKRYLAKSTSIAEPDKSILDIPAHVLTFATPAHGRNGNYIFIDTQRGTGIICDWQNGPKGTELSLTSEREEDEWKSHATYTIPGLFAFLKKQFQDFNVIALDEKQVEDATGPVHPPHEQIKAIFREHGLFTEQYDKDACLQAISQVEA